MDDKNTVKINYAGNSHKQREEGAAEDRPKVEKLIAGSAVQRKKPLGRKIAETFAGDDVHSVGQYILFDVVLPSAKTMISDALSQGIERLLFGESSRRSSSYGTRPANKFTSYNKIYQPDNDRSGTRVMSPRAKANHDFDEIVLEDRGEAEAVIDQISELVERYDVATVSDLYGLVGITGSFTDDKWGWTDLRGSSVSRVRDGWLLNLPRTKPID